RIARARHRDAAPDVLQPVVGLILDRIPDRILLERGVVSTALRHEGGDHAVEDGAVVVLVFDVLEEVRDGLRGFLVLELDFDVPLIHLDDDDCAWHGAAEHTRLRASIKWAASSRSSRG